MLSWMPSSNTTHDSYILCQLEWHHLEIKKQGTKVSMVVDEAFEVASDVIDGNDLVGTLFLGQLTGKVLHK